MEALFCATRERVGHVLGRCVRVPCLLLLLASAVMSSVSLAADLRVTAQESTISDTIFASGSVVRLAASTNTTTFTNCIFDGAGTQLLVEPRTRNFHGAFSMQLKSCEFRNGAQLLVEDAGVISIGKYLHGIELDRTSFSSGSSLRLADTTFVYTASTSSTYVLRVVTTPFPTLGAGAQITITGNAIERPCCGSLYFANLNSFAGWDANASVVISRNEVTVSLDGYSGFLVEAQGGSGPAAPGLPITIDTNRVGFYDLASLGSDSSPIYAVRNASVSVVGNTGVRNIVQLYLAADSSASVEDHADSSDSAGTRIHLQNGRILSLRNVTTRGTLALNNVPLQSMDPIALMAQLRAVRCLQYSFAAFTNVSWVLKNDVVESFQFLSCAFDGTTIRLKPTSAVQASSWFMVGFDKCTFARGAIRMNGENVTASGSSSPIVRITGGTLGPQTDVELIGNEMAGLVPAGLYVNGAATLADTRIVVANNTFTTVQSAIIMTVDLSTARTTIGTLIVCERNTVRGPVAAGSFSLIKSSYRLSNCTLLVRGNDLTAAGTDSTDAYNSVSLWLDNSSSIDLSGNRDRGSRWWTIDGGNVTSLVGLNVTTLALARLPRAPLDLLLTVAFTVSLAFFDQLFQTEDVITFGRYSNLTSRLHFERCYFRTGFVFAATNLGSAFAPTLFVTGSVFEPGLKLLAVSNREAVLKGRPAISIEASQIHRGATIQVANNTLFAADTGATAVLSLQRCTLHGGTVVQVSDNRITFLKSSSLSSVIVIADPTRMPDANVTVRIERNELVGPSTTAAVFLANVGSISASERVSSYERISLLNNSGTNARMRIAVTSGTEVDIQNLTLSGTSLSAYDHGRVQIAGGVLAAMRNVTCMGLEFDTPGNLDRAWSLIPGVSNATSVAFTNTIFPNNTVWRFAPLAPGRLRQLTFSYCTVGVTVGVNTTMDVSVPNVTLLGAPFAYFYFVQFSTASLLAFRESSVLSSGSGGDAAVALAYCTLDGGARVAVSDNNFTVQSTDWEATLLSMRYNTALAGTCFTVENNTLYGNGGALVTLERQNNFPQANATLVVAMNRVMGSATISASAYVALVGYYKSGHFAYYEPVSGLTTILTRNVASPGQVVVRMKSSADLYLTSNRFSGGAYSHGMVAVGGGSIRSLFNHSCQSLGISEPATALWIDALRRIAAVELVSVSYATVPARAVWRLWPQKYAPQATSYSLTYMTFGTECTLFTHKALVNGTGNTPFLTVAYSTFEAGSTVSVQSSTFVATKASHGLLSLYGCTLKAGASVVFTDNRVSSAPRSLSGIAWVQVDYTMFAGACLLAVRDCAFDTEANDKNSLLAFAGTNFFNDTTGTARLDFARNVFATADSVVRVGDASGAASLKQFVFTIVDNVWRASGRATAAHAINVHATSSVWLDGNKDDTLSTDWSFQNSVPSSMSGLVARFFSCNNLTAAETLPFAASISAVHYVHRVVLSNAAQPIIGAVLDLDLRNVSSIWFDGKGAFSNSNITVRNLRSHPTRVLQPPMLVRVLYWNFTDSSRFVVIGGNFSNVTATTTLVDVMGTRFDRSALVVLDTSFSSNCTRSRGVTVLQPYQWTLAGGSTVHVANVSVNTPGVRSRILHIPNTFTADSGSSVVAISNCTLDGNVSTPAQRMSVLVESPTGGPSAGLDWILDANFERAASGTSTILFTPGPSRVLLFGNDFTNPSFTTPSVYMAFNSFESLAISADPARSRDVCNVGADASRDAAAAAVRVTGAQCPSLGSTGLPVLTPCFTAESAVTLPSGEVLPCGSASVPLSAVMQLLQEVRQSSVLRTAAAAPPDPSIPVAPAIRRFDEAIRYVPPAAKTPNASCSAAVFDDPPETPVVRSHSATQTRSLSRTATPTRSSSRSVSLLRPANPASVTERLRTVSAAFVAFPVPGSMTQSPTTRRQQHDTITARRSITISAADNAVPAVDALAPTPQHGSETPTLAVTPTVAVSAAALAAVTSVVNPAAASQPARLMATAALARCGRGLDDPSYVSFPFLFAPVPALDEPSRSPSAYCTDTVRDCDLGATIARGVLQTAVFLLVIVLPGLTYAGVSMIRDSRSPASATSAMTNGTAARLVGVAIGVTAAYFAPTVAGAASGLLYRGWYIGWAGVCCTGGVALVVALLWVASVQYDAWMKSGRPESLSSAVASAFCGGTTAERQQPKHVDPTGPALPDATSGNQGLHGVLVANYFCIDVTSAVLVAAVSGLQPVENPTACRATGLVALVLSVAFAVYATALRPLSRRIECTFLIASAWGQAALALASLVALWQARDAQDDSSTSGVSADRAVEWLTVLLTATFVAQPVVILVVDAIAAGRSRFGSPADAKADAARSSADDTGLQSRLTVPLLVASSGARGGIGSSHGTSSPGLSSSAHTTTTPASSELRPHVVPATSSAVDELDGPSRAASTATATPAASIPRRDPPRNPIASR
jgi:hypothetical protein